MCAFAINDDGTDTLTSALLLYIFKFFGSATVRDKVSVGDSITRGGRSRSIWENITIGRLTDQAIMYQWTGNQLIENLKKNETLVALFRRRSRHKHMPQKVRKRTIPAKLLRLFRPSDRTFRLSVNKHARTAATWLTGTFARNLPLTLSHRTASRLWNTLPQNVTLASSMSVFLGGGSFLQTLCPQPQISCSACAVTSSFSGTIMDHFTYLLTYLLAYLLIYSAIYSISDHVQTVGDTEH